MHDSAEVIVPCVCHGEHEDKIKSEKTGILFRQFTIWQH